MTMTPEQITAGARTVADLATYFEELKGQIGELVAAARASRRGYFIPGEEEEVRHLQVAYWQSRAALFEVVLGFREAEKLPEGRAPEAFLVAFGAAVLLVDAARFVREAFEPLPLVRRKLNEPEPHFGVPGGTYDTVQESLTSPRHAWHLYHAARYFETYRDELRERARGPLLEPVWETVERLRGQLDVPVRRYVRARLRERSRGAVGLLRYGLLGRALWGIHKLAGSLAAEKYLRPGHRPQLPESVLAEFRGLLRPGDVIVTRKEHALSNYFLPGYFKHAALYLGGAADLGRLGIADHENVRPRWAKLLEPQGAGPQEPGPQRVLEALKDGVWIRSTASPLRADAVAALRPRLAPEQLGAALARGMFHEGKPYDFDFDFTRADRLVCTEVVYRAYDGIGGIALPLTRRAGRLTLSAEDLIAAALAGAGFEPVAAFTPTTGCEILTGDEARRKLLETRQPREEM